MMFNLRGTKLPKKIKNKLLGRKRKKLEIFLPFPNVKQNIQQVEVLVLRQT